MVLRRWVKIGWEYFRLFAPTLQKFAKLCIEADSTGPIANRPGPEGAPPNLPPRRTGSED